MMYPVHLIENPLEGRPEGDPTKVNRLVKVVDK